MKFGFSVGDSGPPSKLVCHSPTIYHGIVYSTDGPVGVPTRGTVLHPAVLNGTLIHGVFGCRSINREEWRVVEWESKFRIVERQKQALRNTPP